MPPSERRRLVADAFKDSIRELKENDEARMTQWAHIDLRMARVNEVLS